MIAPINISTPNFKAVYRVNKNFTAKQEKIADRVISMLDAQEYRNKNGETIQEQAGLRADFYIDYPGAPNLPEENAKEINVSLHMSSNIDFMGNRFGRQSLLPIGKYSEFNVEEFPQDFQRVNENSNSDKIRSRIGIISLICGAVAMLYLCFSNGVFANLKPQENMKPLTEKLVKKDVEKVQN